MYRSIAFKHGVVKEVFITKNNLEVRVPRKLIGNIIEDFANWNAEFHKYASLFPVEFRERQILGGLLKSITSTGVHAMGEPSLKRKRRGFSETHGWADFVMYFGNVMWLLEVKHTWCKLNYYQKTELDWLKSEWNNAYDKVKSLDNKSAVESWGNGWHKHFGVIFHIVLIYQRNKSKSEIRFVREKEIIEYINHIQGKINPRPNWIWLWLLSDELQKPKLVDNKWENNPAVCVFMFLKKLK